MAANKFFPPMVEETNAGRAQRVATCVGSEYSFDEDQATGVCDVLVDLLHYCRQHDVDFEGRLEMARVHMQEEVEEEENR